MKNQTTIGHQIKYVRTILYKETQQQLADKVGVSQRTVAHWENDKRTLNHEQVAKLAEVYKISADFLLGLSDNPNPYPTDTQHIEYPGDTPITERRVHEILSKAFTEYEKSKGQ